MTSSVSTRLAAEICRAAAGPLPDGKVVHHVERILLDSIGCALGAINSPAVIAARAWAKRIAGTPSATLLGTRTTSSVLGAALVNSTMVRDLDMNDTYFSRSPSHNSDNLGTCLGVGEAENASAAEIVKSILIAFEVQMRGCEFAKESFFKERGWDQTTLITIASAAAAGALLKLDVVRMTHALGIAGSYPATGEMRVGQISMMKAASAGLAATRGIEAAYLAMEGMTGPPEVFEGQRGLSRLVFGECDWDLLTAPFDDWRLPRTCLKRYPAAYIIHASIDLALTFRRERHIAAADIESVTVETFGWLIEDMVNGMGGHSRYDIDSRETADHSLPFCVAVSLVDGEYGLRQLNERRWEAPEVRALMKKLRFVHDKAMDARFPPDRPARMTIALRNGATHTNELPYPKGDPRMPFSDEEIADKFRSLAAQALTPERQETAIEAALTFSRGSVKALMAACSND